MRQDDDLERKLSQLSQVPFSEDLQRRILYQALEMARNSRQGSPSHGHAWHTASSSVAILARCRGRIRGGGNDGVCRMAVWPTWSH